MSGGFRSRSESARHLKSDAKGAKQTPSDRGASHSDRKAPQQRRNRQRNENTKRHQNQRRSSGGNKPNKTPAHEHHRDVPRYVAWQALFRVDTENAFGNIVLPSLMKEYGLSGRDAAFTTELGYGLLRAQGLVDAVIGECSSRPLEAIDPAVIAVLRLGTYQLLRMRVGNHAAVNTSVDLCQEVDKPKAKGFVNAVLHSVAQRTESEWIDHLTKNADPFERMALATAHPEWIVKVFRDSLGDYAISELSDALIADDARPRVHLVARPGEITAEELALITGGEQTSYSPYGVVLEEGDPGAIPAVREGMAAVQDEGSQLIARAAAEAPLEGDETGQWLDLCAGPGGKTALMACLARIDGAHVDAVEPVPHRARLVEKTTSGLPVTVHTVDGRQSGLEAHYDRTLVDAPCTGLGALRRRPEARWRKSPDDVPGLVTLQRELLAAGAELTHPGGIVVYSTCSPHLEETVKIVDWAEKNCPLQPLDTVDYMCGMHHCRAGENAVQMWPHRHGTDAMFVQIFRRSATPER